MLALQAASALGAVFQFFIRDLMGMMGGILFVYSSGGSFDSNAKQWRLFADVLCDVGGILAPAMLIWCMRRALPLYPANTRVAFTLQRMQSFSTCIWLLTEQFCRLQSASHNIWKPAISIAPGSYTQRLLGSYAPAVSLVVVYPTMLLLPLSCAAMAIDLASPLIPGAFIVMTSLASVARAVMMMAAGATHAALTQHFARGGNAADVSAKAESRERAANIGGMILGMAFTHVTAGGCTQGHGCATDMPSSASALPG